MAGIRKVGWELKNSFSDQILHRTALSVLLLRRLLTIVFLLMSVASFTVSDLETWSEQIIFFSTFDI
jgi:hypothetical protein